MEPKTSNKWTTRSSFEPPLRLSLRFVTWQCAERPKKLYYWSVPSSYWSESSNLIGRRSRDFDKNENGTWSVLLRKAECLVKDRWWVHFLWRRPTSKVIYWHVFHFNSVLRASYSCWFALSWATGIFKETEKKTENASQYQYMSQYFSTDASDKKAVLSQNKALTSFERVTVLFIRKLFRNSYHWMTLPLKFDVFSLWRPACSLALIINLFHFTSTGILENLHGLYKVLAAELWVREAPKWPPAKHSVGDVAKIPGFLTRGMPWCSSSARWVVNW